jgi:D-beta-D-heptose 7-phosphate kinase/D-beta-D-heptose 1-phosphate adenosyltransferase
MTPPRPADLFPPTTADAVSVSLERLRELLGRFAAARVLVVGDCMLDEYLWGRVERISPEAPVPVVELNRTTYAAGGASNVAANVVSMSAGASIVAVVGSDAMGDRLRAVLAEGGVRADGLVVDASRPTTMKTRIIARSQQLLRVDREERRPVDRALEDRLVESAVRQLDSADAVVFSDYSKGVLTERVVTEILAAARSTGKAALANPKPGSISHYRGLSLVTLNQLEAEAVTGMDLSQLAHADAAGDRLTALCDSEAAIITLGGRGLVLAQRGSRPQHLPVVPLEVYDPCGCGDSAIAAACLARVAGADWVEAAALANLAGNAKVRKLGVVPVTRREVEAVWQYSHNLRNGSILNGA